MASPTRNIDSLVPPQVAKKLGFFSLDDIIRQFKDVSLHEMIRVNTNTTFLTNGIKTCYRMEYQTLTFTAFEARDNFTDAVVQAHKDAYVNQQMHSISGEQKDLCFYTYSPQQLNQFLEQNKNNHYTFLPITVHATESANGYRHDMLLIFDNRTRLFYWFDGRNREDYLPFGRDIPKNAIDILLINLADNTKLGYSYEPSPSWMIQGVLQPFASIGQFDFVFSTAWCYLVIQMMDSFDSPTGLLSALDTLSKEDRFHLLYNALLHMIGVYRYHKTVPQNAQINFYEEKDIVATRAVRPDPPTVEATRIAPQPLQVVQDLPNTPKRASSPPVIQTRSDDSELRHRTNSQGYARMSADTEMQPMPIVSSDTVSGAPKKRAEKEGCLVM